MLKRENAARKIVVMEQCLQMKQLLMRLANTWLGQCCFEADSVDVIGQCCFKAEIADRL
jgi:hypothetical protein